MILTSTSATYGVRSTSPATSSGATGGINLGQPETQITLPTANVAWTGQMLLVDPAGVVTAADIDINILAGTVTTATTWVEGNGEAETATVVGGCTTANGTLTLVVTANDVGMTAQNVAVALTTAAHGTASLVAAACRAAISANATIAARFAVSGTGASIVLTRIGKIFKMAGGDVQVHDGINLLVFNIAIPAGLGVSAAPSSTNTPSVATQGTLHRDIDGKDWEGTTLPAIAAGKIGVLQVTSDAASTSLVYLESTAFGFRQMPLSAGGFVLVGASGLNSSMSSSLAITTATNEKSAFLTISVVGSSV